MITSSLTLYFVAKDNDWDCLKITYHNNKASILLQKDSKNLFFLMLTVFDCPGDGTCSGQGTCDGTTGTCVCFEGFERASDTCKGTYWLCLEKSW